MDIRPKLKITNNMVDAARRRTPWDLGNKVLYDLCEQYPAHRQVNEIIAKVWLIGRAYAAAIERRKEKTLFSGDAFYTDHVGPEMKASRIDEWLSRLESLRNPTADNLPDILRCHRRVTELFRDLTKLDKRSLASKYLHFHRPPLFFIYDTRADAALRLLSLPRGPRRKEAQDADNVYRIFCVKCLSLRDAVRAEYSVTLTPREIDNLLLETSRRALRTPSPASARRR
jgi:hypothetical protein